MLLFPVNVLRSALGPITLIINAVLFFWETGQEIGTD
jgi:hypothetical protein